jgi:NADH pyrophosphatase NudC (nudix superfamily)
MSAARIAPPNATYACQTNSLPDRALYMFVADGEVKAVEGPAPSIAWFDRRELTVRDDEAFWVYLGCLAGRDRYAAVRIGNAGAAEAAAFRPARQTGFLSLFQLAHASSVELQYAARALHMGAWLHRSRYCGTCGNESAYITDLNKRVCTNEACRHETFPRIEPAIITLVITATKCLLARQAMFPKGYYAPIAGFVEAGETPEHAVSREVFEETRQVVQKATYVAAQPWPFPSSLMLGFIAHVAPDQPILKSDEIEETIWVDRSKVSDAIGKPGTGPLMLPPPGVIGRMLIEHWLTNEIAFGDTH